MILKINNDYSLNYLYIFSYIYWRKSFMNILSDGKTYLPPSFPPGYWCEYIFNKYLS